LRTRAIASILLVSFASLTFGGPVLAQPADDPVTKAARARFNEGVEFFDKGQFEMARASFLQAYSLKKHPAVLLNLAHSCLKSGHPLEASKYFQQYLRESTTATAAQKADAESGLAESRTRLGRIEVVAPAGTEIYLESDRIGVAPLAEPIDVEPGPHSITGKKDGQSETTKIIMSAGQKSQAKLFDKSATPTPPPPPVPAPATTTPPPVATTPDPTPPPPPPGGDTGPTPEKKSFAITPPLMVTIAGGAVAVVGFGVGLTFFILKNDAQSAADANEAQIRKAASDNKVDAKGICSAPPSNFKNACDTYKNNIDKTNTNATIANIGLVAGIVGTAAAVGGGVWYIMSKNKEAKQGAWMTPVVSPYVTPEQSGVTVLGRF